MKTTLSKILLSLGLCFILNADLTAAIIKTRNSLPLQASHQNLAELACKNGEKHMQLKNYAMAYKSFSEAIKLKPTSKYYCRRGACLMLQKKLDEASKDFDKAIALDKNYAEAYFLKGTAFQFSSETTKAISAYSQAIAIQNNYADAYLMRGLLYATLKSKALACNDLHIALTLGATMAQQHISEICK